MDVNNSAIAAGRAYPAANNFNVGGTAAAATVERQRNTERPATESRADSRITPTSAQSTPSVIETYVNANTNAPRLSELGARVQMDEDLTDVMLDRAFEDANRILEGGNFSLNYSVHEGTGRIMVQIHDKNGELIRELPPESRLDIYARITEFTGLLFDRNS